MLIIYENAFLSDNSNNINSIKHIQRFDTITSPTNTKWRGIDIIYNCHMNYVEIA